MDKEEGQRVSLRDELPDVARWIDWLRSVVGKDEINGQIRKGMKGEPTFAVYSIDGRDPPLLIGTRRPADPPGTREFTADEWLAFVNHDENKGEFGK
jgi:hypothetical protein